MLLFQDEILIHPQVTQQFIKFPKEFAGAVPCLRQRNEVKEWNLVISWPTNLETNISYT